MIKDASLTHSDTVGFIPAVTAIFRIGFVLFTVEFLVMLILPRMTGEGGMETWFAVLEDSFLLAVISTPLIMRWSLKGSDTTKKFIKYDLSFSITAFNVGIAVFSIVFSIECGIMLFIPVTGYEEGSLILATLDASMLAASAAPIVFFLIVLDPGGILTVFHANKLKNVRRQFLMLFLPQVILFSLVTEALYSQEARSRINQVEHKELQSLKLIEDHLSREMEYVVEDLLLLTHNPATLESARGNPDAKAMLLQDFSWLLQAKNRFQSIFLVDSHGRTQVQIDLHDGEVQKTTTEPSFLLARNMPDPESVQDGTITLTGPLVPAHLPRGAIVLRLGSPVMDSEGRVVGMIFLDCFWENFKMMLTPMVESLVGQLQFHASDRSRLDLFSTATTAFPMGDSLWQKVTQTHEGRIGLSSHHGTFLFTTLNLQGRFPSWARHEQRVLHTSSWKIISWVSTGKQSAFLAVFHKRLLILQSFLIGLAAIGSWFFAQAIINHREADARSEQAHQSQITLNALLETALLPMALEKQLRSAIQIVSATPWVGLTGKGAIFIADPEEQHMKLVAHLGLSELEQSQVQKISMGRCLCHQEGNWRRVLQFPQDAPDHVPCLKNKGLQGSYCVPIPGTHGPLGVMHMELKSAAASREEEAFFFTVAGTLSAIIERRRMELELTKTNEELKQTRLDIIHRLGMAAEYRDQDTGLHVVRMSKYAALLAKAAGFSESFCETMLNAAPMHDIGKIGIPDHILLKPARLNEQEWEIMKKHTLIGSMMLHGYDAEPMNTAHIIALTHHERWDGKGYPIGVPGEEIPIEGRICAIADVFDALTSERPYKKAWEDEEALREIRKMAGVAFDPNLVEVFVNIFPEMLAIKKTYTDE